MNFTNETARSEKKTALQKAEEFFGSRLDKSTDSVFTDAAKNNVMAVTGLPFYMPIASALINDPLLYPLLGIKDRNILLTVAEKPVLNYDGDTVSLTDQQQSRIMEIYENVLSACGRLDEDGNLIIDLKSPTVGTHYSVNLLLGDREGYSDPLQTTPKSVLDRFGRGSFRSSQEKQVLATKYELNPDINGETANRQFYITENGRQIFYSLDVNNNVSEACCIHHNNYTEIKYVTECGLEITRTIFILPQQKDFPSAVEAQRIAIKNNTDKIRDLRIVVTGMFGITDPGTLTSDIIYANVVVESETFELNGRPVAIAAHHKPKDCNKEKRFAMIMTNGEPMDEYTSDVNAFLGSGSYDRPAGLARLSNSYSRRGACFFAMAKNITVKPDETVNTDEFVGMSEDKEDVRKDFDTHLYNLYTEFTKPESHKETLNTVRQNFRRYCSFLAVNTDDINLNAYLSYNMPFQVLYQTYISRSFAWTQKSYRETGFREIQDIFASMYYLHASGKDELIRELLGSWIRSVFEFGYAYHNFTTRGKEPGMCSDDQLWLVQAVYRYVRLTGDASFLLQKFEIAGSDRKRTLLETIKAILVYSGRISVGKHHLPLLDTADWNDTLRLDKNVYHGPEKEERYYQQLKNNNQEFGVPFENTQSESVMNAFLLVIAADHAAYLANCVKDSSVKELAEDIKKETVTNIRQYCWKDDFYARCLMNDDRKYKYIGSTGDDLSLDPEINGSYYLNSFSWALLSEVASESEISSMLDVIDRYLKTDAGLKLCTPINYDLLGVVTGTSFYFPGDRENGGVFKHAAMMATVASLKAAKKIKDPQLSARLKDLAFFMIDKTLPYKTMEDPFILKGNPRFCTQYNNSETGENIGPILSGTSSWLTLALFEVCGLNIEGNRLIIAPVVNRPHFIYALNINDTIINVSIDATNNYRITDSTEYRLDGKSTSSSIILPTDGNVHEIRVIL